jgi:hypothetical protein
MFDGKYELIIELKTIRFNLKVEKNLTDYLSFQLIENAESKKILILQPHLIINLDGKFGNEPLRESWYQLLKPTRIIGIQEYPVRLPLSHHSFTDHKNNTFNDLKASDCVLRTCWLLLLEEYEVTFEYLPGKKNVVADALSRFNIDSLKIQEETEE